MAHLSLQNRRSRLGGYWKDLAALGKGKQVKTGCAQKSEHSPRWFSKMNISLEN